MLFHFGGEENRLMHECHWSTFRHWSTDLVVNKISGIRTGSCVANCEWDSSCSGFICGHFIVSDSEKLRGIVQ